MSSDLMKHDDKVNNSNEKAANNLTQSQGMTKIPYYSKHRENMKHGYGFDGRGTDYGRRNHWDRDSYDKYHWDPYQSDRTYMDHYKKDRPDNYYSDRYGCPSHLRSIRYDRSEIGCKDIYYLNKYDNKKVVWNQCSERY